MNFDDAFPGRCIKSAHFGGQPVTVRLVALKLEKVKDDDGSEKVKLFAMLDREIGPAKSREWAINRTNGLCLKAMYGPDLDRWSGHRVTLYAAPNPDSARGFGEATCIRVRGSPDLSAPVRLEAKNGRRKLALTLDVTHDERDPKPAPQSRDAGAIAAPRSQTAPAPLPPVDHSGEVQDSTGAWVRIVEATADVLTAARMRATDFLARTPGHPTATAKLELIEAELRARAALIAAPAPDSGSAG